jgi:hypothetical protein
MMTHGEPGVLAQVIQGLWKRHGREDVALAALLLANLQDGEDVWVRLAEVIGNPTTAEALLLSIEECYRAKHAPPSEELLLTWCSMSAAHAHLALLTKHADWVRTGRPELSSAIRTSIQAMPYPDGDSLLGRVRDQMLDS